MPHSDGPPQQHDSQHSRSNSRSPVSPGYTGETLAEREESRLAEAAYRLGIRPGSPGQPPLTFRRQPRGLVPAK